MKLRSLFRIVIVLLCVFCGVMSVSIYANRKLKKFNVIQARANELPLKWSQFQETTQRLLVTYELRKIEKEWLDNYQQFKDRIETFLVIPFTRELLAKDIDFHILVTRAKVHWDIMRDKFDLTSSQLSFYLNKYRMLTEDRDSGNLLVNFGQNWATGSYDTPLIDTIAHLRKNTSKSDSLFAEELEAINQHVVAEVKSQAGQIEDMTILLSALILGIAGIFVLYHFVSMERREETSREYAHGLSREIEERKQLEKKLRTERRKLRVVLEAMGEGIYIVNQQYDIEHQSEFLEREYGLGLDQLCHNKYFETDSPCPFCQISKTIESGLPHQAECTLGDGRNYELIFSPFDDLDGETKVIVLRYDITERKKIEAETQRVGHLASIGELAAGIAHEINNPINGIISIAEIIRDQIEDTAAETTLPERIIKESERIARIAKNLLYFSRNRSDKYHSCYIEKIVTDALDLVRKQLAKDCTKIDIKALSDLPSIVAQSQEIQQVFLNIISNARYAMNHKQFDPYEQKILEISGKVIKIKGQRYLQVAFHDRGNGIPVNILDKICNPFFTTKPKGEGTGLGLSISHGIMEAHGGRLRFQSKVDQYTKVLVEFPLKEAGAVTEDGADNY